MSRKVPPVHYTIGPVLSSKAPIGRSRFLVFAVALGFLGLAGRAAYIQVWKQDFFFFFRSAICQNARIAR